MLSKIQNRCGLSRLHWIKDVEATLRVLDNQRLAEAEPRTAEFYVCRNLGLPGCMRIALSRSFPANAWPCRSTTLGSTSLATFLEYRDSLALSSVDSTASAEVREQVRERGVRPGSRCRSRLFPSRSRSTFLEYRGRRHLSRGSAEIVADVQPTAGPRPRYCQLGCNGRRPPSASPFFCT